MVLLSAKNEEGRKTQAHLKKVLEAINESSAASQWERDLEVKLLEEMRVAAGVGPATPPQLASTVSASEVNAPAARKEGTEGSTEGVGSDQTAADTDSAAREEEGEGSTEDVVVDQTAGRPTAPAATEENGEGGNEPVGGAGATAGLPAETLHGPPSGAPAAKNSRKAEGPATGASASKKGRRASTVEPAGKTPVAPKKTATKAAVKVKKTTKTSAAPKKTATKAEVKKEKAPKASEKKLFKSGSLAPGQQPLTFKQDRDQDID